LQVAGKDGRGLNSGNAFETIGDNDTDDKQENHQLERQWALWYNPATAEGDKWFESLHQVGALNTIEDFWRLYNNIVTPSNLKPRTFYLVFVNGV
jgi:hypothetical protein